MSLSLLRINSLSRSNVTTFEERFNRLRKEMDQMREERTRLTLALDFSKDERNQLVKQLKELEEKAGMTKNKCSVISVIPNVIHQIEYRKLERSIKKYPDG